MRRRRVADRRVCARRRLAALSPVLGRIRLPARRRPGCWFRWTTRRPTTSRPTASHSALLERGGRAEWLLNYRGGSFLLPADAATTRDAALAGVTTEPLDDGQVAQIRGEIADGNMDAVPLEKAPKVAVYAPPNAAPWDDAVTMALNYAGIKYDKIWDPEVLRGRLKTYDWLHLHHEDFTGQYSKFYLNYAGAPWLVEMVERNQAMARPARLSLACRRRRARSRAAIADYVERGGFLFAMCTATETLDLALAAESVDIAAAYADGTPMDPRRDRAGCSGSGRSPSRTRSWSSARPCRCIRDIDGHQVNSPERRQPLGAFTLFNFSAKFDPVATMLVQNHRQVIPDFYGLTTSFTRRDASSRASPCWPRSRARPGSSTSTASTGRARGPSSAGTTRRIRSTRSVTRRPT